MRENLKAARKAAGLTQQQVADYLGLSLIGYSQIERGVRIGKIETWDKLEDLFKIHQRLLRIDSDAGPCASRAETTRQKKIPVPADIKDGESIKPDPNQV